MSDTPLLTEIIADQPLPPEVVAPAGAPTLYTAEGLPTLLALAELPLGEQRSAELLAALTDLEAAVHAIRAVDLGETPPATAFDARWE